MDEQHPLADRVRAVIARECGMALQTVHLKDRLEEDLGMTGDDAGEFLEAFSYSSRFSGKTTVAAE